METTRDAVDDLMAFLDAAPSPYHAVAEATRRLDEGGFVALDPATRWPAVESGYLAEGGALVAWTAPAGDPALPLAVIGAHTDSPNLRIRPRPDHEAEGVAQLGVEPYGGLLTNSWLDRDLGLSGRVVIRDGDGQRTVLFRDDRPLLRVPQLAIHLDRGIDEHGLRLDRSRHLTPIWALGSAPAFTDWLADALGIDPTDVLAWDLMTHDVAGAARTGLAGELLASGRLDNLCSCHGALSALLERARRTAPADDVAMVVLFDHEEVGSTSATGAAGALLRRVVERVVAGRGGGAEEVARSLAAGRVLSADMAHATHPNYPERHDPDHPIRLGGGPVVKTNVNQRYATSAPGAAEFRRRCDAAGVPTQVYAHRNDLPCGSTIGPMTAAAMGTDTVDVGMPQLAMHSAREVMATADVDHMLAAFAAWFA